MSARATPARPTGWPVARSPAWGERGDQLARANGWTGCEKPISLHNVDGKWPPPPLAMARVGRTMAAYGEAGAL